jgi:hypothetical protein
MTKMITRFFVIMKRRDRLVSISASGILGPH